MKCAIRDFAVNHFDRADFNAPVTAAVFQSGCFNVKADDTIHGAVPLAK